MHRPTLFLVAALAACCSLSAQDRVVVDGSIRHQTIVGFGTCLISWTPEMAAWYRRPEAARIFAEDLRFNIIRANFLGEGTIGPRERPENILHTDPEFARNDVRTPVFIDFYHRVAAINPDVLLIGSVWSPPAWMKFSNAIRDDRSGAIMGDDYIGDKGGVSSEFLNRVRPEMYPHFAQWVVEMVRYYRAHGVPVYAVSAANEPQFTQDFESCVWTPRDLATITGLVGEALAKAGLGHVQLFGPETLTSFNWEGGPNFRYTRALREDVRAWAHLGFFATHGYADGVRGESEANSSTQFWNIIRGYGKPYWVTEGGTGEHNWPAPVLPGGVALAAHNALVAGNASAFVPWQYAEDAEIEHNLMPLSGPNKKTHAIRHYSRFIPRGSVRVETTPAFGDVNTSAFVHGEDVTVVLVNPTERTRRVEVAFREITTPARLHAVVTSIDQNSAVLPSIPLIEGTATIEVPGPGIVTLTTLP